MTREEIAARLGEAPRPKALLLTRLDGPVGEAVLVTEAGGTPCAGLDDAPETLLVALDGKTLDEAEGEVLALADRPGWWELPCVASHECYLLAAEHLSDEAVARQIVATILHPEVFTELLPPFSVRMFPEELYRRDPQR